MYEPLKADLGDVMLVQARMLSAELLMRARVLTNKMRILHLEIEADELVSIFDACDAEFAAEFDAGYEHAQETVGEWFERQGGTED